MARALGSIDKPTAVPALVTALRRPSPRSRRRRWRPCARSRASRTRPAAALLTDADEQVRAEAALRPGVLLRTGKTGVQPANVDSLLTVLANDPSVNVRKKAAWSLGEMGAPVTLAAAGLQKAATSDAARSSARWRKSRSASSRDSRLRREKNHHLGRESAPEVLTSQR